MYRFDVRSSSAVRAPALVAERDARIAEAMASVREHFDD